MPQHKFLQDSEGKRIVGLSEHCMVNQDLRKPRFQARRRRGGRLWDLKILSGCYDNRKVQGAKDPLGLRTHIVGIYRDASGPHLTIATMARAKFARLGQRAGSHLSMINRRRALFEILAILYLSSLACPRSARVDESNTSPKRSPYTFTLQ